MNCPSRRYPCIALLFAAISASASSSGSAQDVPAPSPPRDAHPRVLRHGDRLELSFTAEQVAAAKDGPLERFVLGIPEEALVVIWARSKTLDTGLSVSIATPDEVDPVEVSDSSSGGGPDPCIQRAAKAGERWTISLQREAGEPLPASVTVAAWLSPVDDDIRAAIATMLRFEMRVHFLLAGGRVSEARALAAESVAAVEAHPPGHHGLAMRRLAQGVSCLRMQALRESSVHFRYAHETYERTLPPDHLLLQHARSGLARTMHSLGDIHGSRLLYERILDSYERTRPQDHPDPQLARGELGVLLYDLGDYHGSRALHEMVLAVLERTLPPDHSDLSNARANLAATLAALGDLAGARALQERVLDVYERTLREDNKSLQWARLNLAGMLYSLGDLPGAQAIQERALELWERILPPDHLDLQTVRGALAVTMAARGDPHGARSLYERVLDVRERMLPPDHPDLQLARGALAVIKHSLGDLHGARALHERLLDVQERMLPPDHPNLQSTRGNLAWILAQSAAARRLRTGPDASQERPSDEEWLSTDGPWKEALRLVRGSAAAMQGAVRRALLDGSPREAAERIGGAVGRPLNAALTFATGFGYFDSDEGLFSDAFALSEAARAASLASAVLARSPGDSADRDRLRAAVREAAEELVRLASAGATPEDYHAARSRREAAERDLLALARAQAGERAAILDVDLDSLSSQLGEREALAGFRRTARMRMENVEAVEPEGEPSVAWRSAEHIGAFVLARPGDGGEAALRWIDLGPAEPIERAVEGWRAWAAAGRRMEPADAESDPVHRSGSRLRALVWDPLLEALGDAERVTVALDDVLHLVPLDALPLDGGGYLGDRVRIETRVALWELLDAPPPVAAGGALVALGGADFGPAPSRAAAPEDVAASGVVVSAPAGAGILRGGPRERGFEPLPQTEPETRGIAALAQQALGGDAKTVVLSGRDASRQALTEAAPKARWLHIATHGWYAPESIKSWSDARGSENPGGSMLRAGMDEVVRGMNPMLLCGLALAGANLPADSLGRTPGLLTAEELSAFDLSNCELAVLSACDTNIGERRAGQGVASLQMALQMAGARTVVTSLWKVPDEATRDLMLDFYRRIWVEKKPKHQALREAKARLRAMKDSKGRPLYTTRDWAAWVLTGDPG